MLKLSIALRSYICFTQFRLAVSAEGIDLDGEFSDVLAVLPGAEADAAVLQIYMYGAGFCTTWLH